MPEIFKKLGFVFNSGIKYLVAEFQVTAKKAWIEKYPINH